MIALFGFIFRLLLLTFIAPTITSSQLLFLGGERLIDMGFNFIYSTFIKSIPILLVIVSYIFHLTWPLFGWLYSSMGLMFFTLSAIFVPDGNSHATFDGDSRFMQRKLELESKIQLKQKRLYESLKRYVPVLPRFRLLGFSTSYELSNSFVGFLEKLGKNLHVGFFEVIQKMNSNWWYLVRNFWKVSIPWMSSIWRSIVKSIESWKSYLKSTISSIFDSTITTFRSMPNNIYHGSLLLSLFWLTIFTSVPAASQVVTHQTYQCHEHHSHVNMQALERVALISNDKSFGEIDPSLTIFDTDTIGACPDNCTTQHVCNNPDLMSDLIDIPFDIPMQSVGGIACPKQIGTMTLIIRDDKGIDHVEQFPDTYLMPESPKILISPVQWAQQIRQENENSSDELPIKHTGISSWETFSELTWRGKYTKTFDHATRLPEMPVNEGYNLYSNFFNKFYSYASTHASSFYTPDPEYFDNTCSSSSSSSPPMNKQNEGDNLDEGDLASEDQTDNHFHEWNPTFSINDQCRLLEHNHLMIVSIIKVIPPCESNAFIPHYDVKVVGQDTILTNISEEYLHPFDQVHESSIPDHEEELNIEEIRNNASEKPATSHQYTDHLSPLQQELLDWHNRLGHVSFKTLIRLANLGIIPRRLRKVTQFPVCPSCLFGKHHKRPWRTKGKSNVRRIRKESDDKPGANTSIDHMVSAQPGLIPQVTGTLTLDRFWAACIFVDHFTGYLFVYLQRGTSALETINAKLAYEQHASTFGVDVLGYHGDNGRFAEKDFKSSCQQKNQKLTFCGVGAHFQNGIAERAIKELTLQSRTMLLHAQHMWPEAISTMLWPFALKAAQERLNRIDLNKDGKTREQLFSGTNENGLNADDFHVFGCPVYVLDPRLQSGISALPKWEPRCRVGVYLGHSPQHAGNVALVLNLSTGHVSPQYHVVFDDKFTTVPHMKHGTVPPNWKDLFENNREQVSSTAFDKATEWLNPDVPITEDSTTSPSDLTQLNEGASSSTPSTTSLPEGEIDNSSSSSSNTSSDDNLLMPNVRNLNMNGVRRSARIAKQKKVSYLSLPAIAKSIFSFSLFEPSVDPSSTPTESSSFLSRTIHRIESANLLLDNTFNYLSPYSLMTDEGNETFTYSEMMKLDDRSEFIKAMLGEVDDHFEREHMELVPRARAGNNKLIRLVWSFKRKRLPNGELLKHKSRLCCHGGMQQWGVNYWETYSPVVNWMSVRLMLTMSLLHNLQTKSIDFVLAFPQAPLDVEIFAHLPQGFKALPGLNEHSTILLIKKNLYGLKDAGLKWFEHLKSGLVNQMGFSQSDVDPCVFFKEGIIILVYVDDCLLFSDSERLIDETFKQLETMYKLTDEGSIDKYLGIDIKRKKGEYHLTQPLLQQRVVQAIKGISEANPKYTPATAKVLLHKDSNGQARKGTWNYRSMIGMMNFLANSTRPDIQFAVHQCARFCIDPKLSHEAALKHCCKYINTTKDKGLILRPDKSKGLECYVDADFAGAWNQADSSDASSVFSRTGFTIMYCNCPILWVSKLQTEVALSTTEAEYIALSQAMRDVIPAMSLIEELNKQLKLKKKEATVRCTLFEDNNGALELAKAPKMRPRTKHIAIKYHHFRSHVQSGAVDIQPIDTQEQIADIFTKALPRDSFEKLRKKLNGW